MDAIIPLLQPVTRLLTPAGVLTVLALFTFVVSGLAGRIYLELEIISGARRRRTLEATAQHERIIG